jgi:hypothetical protein
MAALTTQSQLTATTTAETSASVVAAIHQLHANQQAMQQQFAAFMAQHNTTYQTAPTVQPPITRFSIPYLATFSTAGRGVGRHGGLGQGGRVNFVNTGGRNARTPFTNYVGRGGQSGLPPIGGGTGRGGGVLPFTQQTIPRNAAPMYLNIIKKYANWNVCFHVDLTPRMGIPRRHAPPRGEVQITRKGSTGITRDNTSKRGTTRAPKQCTRVSYPICDGGGQSRQK